MSGTAKRCGDVMDRLMASLREGGDVSSEDRQHVATCPECNRVLAAAGQLEDELAADIPVGGTEEQVTRVTRAAEATLRATLWHRVAFIVLGAVAVLIPRFVVPEVMKPELHGGLQEIGVLVGLGAVGTLIVEGLNRRPGSVKLYKRLKRQWFFGVCRGLAEAAGLSVWVIRVFFILLLFVGKTGWLISVPLYLLLDMSLHVHPEDRGLLYRFRLNRWLARISASLRRRPAGYETTSS